MLKRLGSCQTFVIVWMEVFQATFEGSRLRLLSLSSLPFSRKGIYKLSPLRYMKPADTWISGMCICSHTQQQTCTFSRKRRFYFSNGGLWTMLHTYWWNIVTLANMLIWKALSDHHLEQSDFKLRFLSCVCVHQKQTTQDFILILRLKLTKGSCPIVSYRSVPQITKVYHNWSSWLRQCLL
jgi:hypothetical protein